MKILSVNFLHLLGLQVRFLPEGLQSHSSQLLLVRTNKCIKFTQNFHLQKPTDDDQYED